MEFLVDIKKPPPEIPVSHPETHLTAKQSCFPPRNPSDSQKFLVCDQNENFGHISALVLLLNFHLGLKTALVAVTRCFQREFQVNEKRRVERVVTRSLTVLVVTHYHLLVRSVDENVHN